MPPPDVSFPPRCILFFPGSRPDRYPKALAAGADCVCMDLEDAVEPEAKDDARANAVELVSTEPGGPARSIVRVNHPDTPEGEEDLRALAALPADRPLEVMVPKVSGPADLDAVRERLGRGRRQLSLVAVIETARGLHHVEEIATVPDLSCLVFGGVDLSAELGASLEWDALLYARSRVVHAAALGGVGAVDVPFLDTSDGEGLLAETTAVRALGFRGKAAIHPGQVATILGVFWPTPAQIERARRVVEAAESRAGAFLLDGAMVDRPIIEAARRVVALAEAGR